MSRGFSRRGLLRLSAALILALGLGLAAKLYITAPQQSPAQGYALEGGQAFETSPWDSRSFRRGMETIGGKQAVFLAQLREDLAGFFSGETLALLLALASACCAGGLLYLAERAERADVPDVPDGPDVPDAPDVSKQPGGQPKAPGGRKP